MTVYETTLNHRILGKDKVDLDILLSKIATSKLSPKGIYKFLKAALYNIDQRDADKAWKIYETMVHYKVDKYLKDNQYGYLLGILKYGNVNNLLTVMENIKTSGQFSDTHHIFQVLFALSKQGLVDKCCQLVEHLEPTASHYHSLATALRNAPQKDPATIEKVAKIMLNGMQNHHIKIDPSTLAIMLSLLDKTKDDLIFQFFKTVDHDPSTYNVYIYTSLIAGFARQGDSKSAKRLFDEMQKHKVKPNQVTYAALMEAYGRAGEFDAAQTLLVDYRKKYKNLNNNPLVTSLLVNAIRHHNLPVAEYTAKLIRRNIKDSDRDDMLRTALLWLKAKTDVDAARREFDYMYNNEPALLNDIMTNHLVKALAQQGEKELVLETVKKMRKRKGPRSQHYLTNALFHCRDVFAALSIFGSMREQKIPDDITLAMVIQGLVMNHEGNLAWRLFKTLQNQEIEPNLHAYSSMLHVFAHPDKQRKDTDIDEKTLEKAGIRARVSYSHPPSTEALYLFRSMTGFQQPNAYTYTTLIACFAKTNLTQAIRIFDHMRSSHVDPTTETYTALLQGCAIFRNSQMAITIFTHMCDHQVKPNSHTWRYLLKSLLRGRVDRKEIDKLGKMARKAMAID